MVYKTEVCKKSLNPIWNSDWYRFEVSDALEDVFILYGVARTDFGGNAGAGGNIFRGGAASSPRPPWNVRTQNVTVAH
jgi:hypothetical protein